MIREFVSDLPKLGSRPYIQGGTIFNSILDACDAELGPGWLADSKIDSFKLEREAVANGRIIVSDEPITVEANATFLAQGNGRAIRGVFIDEGRPWRTEPYDEDSFYRVREIGAALSGRFVLPAGRSRADFIKGIVGANKRLHQEARHFSAPLSKIQFLYLKGLEGACLTYVDAELDVEISNLTSKEVDGEAWSINQIVIGGDGIHSRFRLCYRAVVTA